MRVLVTGGAGFLASYIAEAFAKRGDEVVCLDNMTTSELERTGYPVGAARWNNERFVSGLGCKVIVGSITDASLLAEAAEGTDFIAHTAAQPAMTISSEDPVRDMQVNVRGTLNVLEVARRADIPVASCSTIHVYGNALNRKAGHLVDESYPLLEEGSELTPLHASKAAGDSYVRAYADTYGLKAATFRLTGMYGPRQFGGSDHGWVANFAIRAVTGRKIEVYGDGEQTRDILYGSDAADAFVKFWERPVAGAYNVGGGPKNEVSLNEVLKMLARFEPKVDYLPERLGDLKRFVCDTSKAERILGWSAKVGPKEGVEKTVGWICSDRGLFG